VTALFWSFSFFLSFFLFVIFFGKLLTAEHQVANSLRREEQHDLIQSYWKFIFFSKRVILEIYD